MNDDTKELIVHCERNGVDWARVHVPGLGNSDAAIAARHWIAEQDRTARAANDIQQAAVTKATLQAADSTRSAARWTMVAAIAAALSVIVPLLQAKGWLPK